MTLYEILKAKGSTVYTIGPGSSLLEATEELARRNVGALVVIDRDLCEGERLLGIVTERDLIRFCATSPNALATTKVADIMTTELFTGTPADTLESAMGVMTTRRVRHLPILSESRLVGLISIGDLVKNQLDQLALENQFMKNYIQG